jgi:hypothetical protein
MKSRAEILALDDRPTETMTVPEWDTELVLRGLTLAQLTNISDRAKRDGETDGLRATVFTFIEGVVEPRFDVGDYDALRNKSAGVVNRVSGRIMELSGMGAGAVDNATKNSEPTQAFASGTD